MDKKSGLIQICTDTPVSKEEFSVIFFDCIKFLYQMDGLTQEETDKVSSPFLKFYNALQQIKDDRLKQKEVS